MEFRDRFGQFGENVGFRVIDDGVHRIQTQSIEMVFVQPVERVVDEEVADRPALWAIEVDPVAPRSTMAIGKELRRVGSEIIPFRAKVVVDHVQENHDSAFVRALNQIL